jgi:peptidoglycan/LPS O-acetylase OafA/YrhL
MSIKKYRNDIDGLRSIAILPVLFFHAGFTVFQGGFIGVDIFFVISGFLITNLLIDDIEKTGKLNIVGFYERRIRRITPILFFTLFVTLILAIFILKPVELIKFSKSANATILFFSNIFFWRESSYFDIANETKPLLHTWSLSIEEQFYLFFPLLLALLMKFKYKTRLISLIFIFSFSVVLAELLTSTKPVASFYLIPTRSFELLAGSISAILIMNKSFKARIFNLNTTQLNALCIIAFLCITAPIFLFKESMHIPGLISLIPCIGVAIICILGARENLISDFLSFKPLVFIGLISYSLYIWHQPVFAFARIISVNQLNQYHYLGLLLAVFILSILSWKFIEQPFRNKLTISKRNIFNYFFISSGILLGLNTIVTFSNGLPQRYTNSQLKLINMGTDGRRNAEKCSGWREKPFEINHACSLGDSKIMGDASVLLFGDSHGAAIAHALSEKLKSLKLKGIQATYLGCPPAIEIERTDNSFKCADFSSQVMNYLKTHPSIKTVVIAARWTLLTKQSSFDNMEGGKEPAESPVYKNYLDGESLIDNSVITIKEILKMDKLVILIYPIPEVGWNVPNRFLRLPIEKWTDVSTSHQVYLSRTLEVRKAFNNLNESELTKVYPDKVLCGKNERCITVSDNQPLYYDDDHLSLVGATMVLDSLNIQNFAH